MDAEMSATLRLLFLDFDGVLNSRKYFNQRGPRTQPEDDIDPATIELVNEIIRQTGASIVVSSTWRRLFDPDWITAMLERKGLWARIVGSTPYVRPRRFSETIMRGQEIATFIDSFPRQIASFSILDDGNDMLSLTHRLARTDSADGLTCSEVTKAIEHLGTDLTREERVSIERLAFEISEDT
jgi:hypothetical protein